MYTTPGYIMFVCVYVCVCVSVCDYWFKFLFQRGTPAKEAIDPSNNQPHIVRFVDASGDIPPSYFIAVEQQLLLECRNIQCAVFLMLAVYYVFNIEYCVKVKDVLYFIQDRVLSFPDHSMKLSSLYRNTSAAIDLYLVN